VVQWQFEVLAFGQQGHGNEVAVVTSADLAAASRRQLLAAGLLGGRIELSGICTACHADWFYSERRLGRPTGRVGAFVGLR
jgi:copper oxidase (laccase) domain-containing protein